MIEVFAKGPVRTAIVPKQDDIHPAVAETGTKVAVLKLTGSIGKDKQISELIVRQFVGGIGDAERLHLVINSDGGKVDEANRIYLVLRSIPLPISAEVNMKTWSAAVTILLAADFRWARAGASILIHQTRTEISGWLTAPQLFDRFRDLRASDESELDLLALRTGFDRRWFARHQATEELMLDNDAVLCGLLHAIEGKVPFSFDNLTAFDQMYFSGAVESSTPSKMLAANYRAASTVAAMCQRSVASSNQTEKL